MCVRCGDEFVLVREAGEEMWNFVCPQRMIGLLKECF